jgi:hypothetical protein
MWKTKEFKTIESRNNWIRNHKHLYQIEIVFINNGYGVEYKKLRTINIK